MRRMLLSDSPRRGAYLRVTYSRGCVLRNSSVNGRYAIEEGRCPSMPGGQIINSFVVKNKRVQIGTPPRKRARNITKIL